MSFAVGGTYGQVFHGVVAVAGEEGKFVGKVVAKGGSEEGTPEESLIIGVAGVVCAVNGFVIAEFCIADRRG